MKKYFVKTSFIIIFLFVLFFGCSCSRYVNQNTGESERYSCKDYEFSVALVEMVDAKTNGEISGETHFSSKEGSEIFYSYHHYKSNQEALDNLEKEKTEAKELIKEGSLKNKNGKIIGGKVVFYDEEQGTAGLYKNYYLLWTKNSSFYWIRSESTSGIEEIEKECKF